MREVFQQELAEVQDRLAEIAGLVAISIEKATQAFNKSTWHWPKRSSRTTTRSTLRPWSSMSWRSNPRPAAAGRPRPAHRRARAAHQRVARADGRHGRAHRPACPDALPRPGDPQGAAPDVRRDGRLDVQIGGMLTELLRTEASSRRGDPQRRRQGRRAAPERLREGARRHLARARRPTTVDATLASRYHERFADHAVSIAKKVAVPRHRRVATPARSVSSARELNALET